MMPLKFRVWDEINKCWYKENVYIHTSGLLMGDEDYYDLGATEPKVVFMGLKVMQFTGLKDSKGVGIYEGDIVKGTWWCDYIYIGTIKFGVTKDLDYDFYGWFIDHIDHNGLNNQRSNLRVCSHSSNSKNRRLYTKKGSQYKGVKQSSKTKYMARIRVDGALLYLGVFTSEKNAAIAYNKAAIKHFGKYAHLNIIE